MQIKTNRILFLLSILGLFGCAQNNAESEPAVPSGTQHQRPSHGPNIGGLSALDNEGKSVDWWFMYKVSSRSTGNESVNGTQYVYLDSNGAARNEALAYVSYPNGNPSFTVDKNGALPNTLNQIYQASKDNHRLGWWFYNDENPINGTTTTTLGHTKGVVAFDFETDTAFWLIQSTPKFPPEGRYTFPSTGMVMAQSFLCITLKDASTMIPKIAAQMCSMQHPSVYLASAVPAGLADNPNDPVVFLLQFPNKHVSEYPTGGMFSPASVPWINIESRNGQHFWSIAKAKTDQKSFYNDTVGSSLHVNLDVETWEHGAAPTPENNSSYHNVIAATSVNLQPLGVDIQWSEENDHAKLAITDPNNNSSNSYHWVCVGDINFTESQEMRSGGTVAFISDPLWRSLNSIFQETKIPPRHKN